MKPAWLRAFLLPVVLLLALLQTPAAEAHLLPRQTGTVNVVGNAVFVVVAVPVSVLSSGDDNKDGSLSITEWQQHQHAIERELDGRFTVSNHGQLGHTALLNVLFDSDKNIAGIADVTLLKKVVFDAASFNAASDALQVATDLFGRTDSERQLTLRIKRGTEREVVVLRPSRAEARLFQSRFVTLRDYIALGIEHILSGADHLLFVLTIFLASKGWRYWAATLSSFTVAHSVTLTLALTGALRFPAALAEALIALSLVLAASLLLWRRSDVRPIPLLATSGFVFGCGLIHGAGFAAAISTIGLDDRHLVSSLLGFNLGIELGQMAVVLALLMLLWFTQRYFRAVRQRQLVSSATVTVMVVGLYWLVERSWWVWAGG